MASLPSRTTCSSAPPVTPVSARSLSLMLVSTVTASSFAGRTKAFRCLSRRSDHRRTAGGVQGQEGGRQAARQRGHGTGHRIGNVMQLQIDEQGQTFPDRFRQHVMDPWGRSP